MLMVLFMGVTPVFAADDEYDIENAAGASSTSGMLFFYVDRNTTSASYRYNFFNGEDGTSPHPILVELVDSKYVHKSDSVGVRKAGVGSGYIEYIFSMPSSGVLTFTNEAWYMAYILRDTTAMQELTNYDDVLNLEFFIDGVSHGVYNAYDGVPVGDYDVEQRFSFRISSADGISTFYTGESTYEAYLGVELQMEGVFSYDAGSIVPDPTDPSVPSDPSDPSDPGGSGSGGSQDLHEVIDSIEVVQGHLEEINGNLVDIKDSIQEVEVTIKETKEELEDPTSPIWEAAGSKIKDSITSLFVPTEEELNAKMEEIENIVTEKLGDTVEVVERVEQYEDELVSGFTGGGRQYDFHFPGISVPLPSGTVTILPESDVHIENDAFIIFRDLLGNGVALLCGFAAFHMIHDFLICILSGVTWWGWIRGRHDQ